MLSTQKYTEKTKSGQSGMILLSVVCFAALASVLAASLVSDSIYHIRLARNQQLTEQTFCVAEAGAEIAVAYLNTNISVGQFYAGWACLTGQTVVGTVTGTYNANIVARRGFGPRVNVNNAGPIQIDPSALDSQFILIKPDGSIITHTDLLNDTTAYPEEPCVYYEGPAKMILMRPQGSGNQLYLDGSLSTLSPTKLYRLFSMEMDIKLSNPTRNAVTGRVADPSQWALANLHGKDVVYDPDAASVNATLDEFTIVSRGQVADKRRQVIMTGVRQQTWARYALWYDHSGGEIWISGTEVFNGPVHANAYIYLKDTPTFYDTISSTRTSWGSGSDASKVNFFGGVVLGADKQDMLTVNFTQLRNQATLILTGATHITMSGTNTFITNGRKSWNKHRIDTPTNGVIYISNAGSGTGTNAGTTEIGGTLDGRLTVIADNSIHITNHVQYTTHPTNDSVNALGLIANKDVMITTNAPKNLNIYAHIIAANTATNFNAGFYVKSYDDQTKLKYRGVLSVYGGIVQNNRGAVGLVGNTAGYSKNYVYDQRFFNNPPPQYPTVQNLFQWLVWEEKPW